MKSLFIQHLISSGARAYFLAAEAKAEFLLAKTQLCRAGNEEADQL